MRPSLAARGYHCKTTAPLLFGPIEGTARLHAQIVCVFGTFAAKWYTKKESAPAQSLPRPALKHARTEVQSESESRPIRRTSRLQQRDGKQPEERRLRSSSRLRLETRRLRRHLLSRPFVLLLLKPFERCECSFAKIVVRPGIRPVNPAVAPEIRKLLRPSQHFPGLVRRKHPHNFDQRLFTTRLNRQTSDLKTSCTDMMSASGVQPGTSLSPGMSGEISVTVLPSTIAAL